MPKGLPSLQVSGREPLLGDSPETEGPWNNEKIFTKQMAKDLLVELPEVSARSQKNADTPLVPHGAPAVLC